eukprot:scaffold6232_cov85-Phaeocystis_antarctica.AAC.1
MVDLRFQSRELQRRVSLQRLQFDSRSQWLWHGSTGGFAEPLLTKDAPPLARQPPRICGVREGACQRPQGREGARVMLQSV